MYKPIDFKLNNNINQNQNKRYKIFIVMLSILVLLLIMLNILWFVHYSEQSKIIYEMKIEQRDLKEKLRNIEQEKTKSYNDLNELNNEIETLKANNSYLRVKLKKCQNEKGGNK